MCSCAVYGSLQPPGMEVAWEAPAEHQERERSLQPSSLAWGSPFTAAQGAGVGPGVCWQWHRSILRIRSSIQPCHE